MEGRLAIAPAIFPHSCVLFSWSTFCPFSLSPESASHCKTSRILSLSRTPLPPRSTIDSISLMLSSGRLQRQRLISGLLSFQIHCIPLGFGPAAARALRHIAISATCHWDGSLDACANESVRKISIVSCDHAPNTLLSAIHFSLPERRKKNAIFVRNFQTRNIMFSFRLFVSTICAPRNVFLRFDYIIARRRPREGWEREKLTRKCGIK